MSSSVFYKFKNSKEPERIVFDGTDISVFELKREIIIASGLGDGSDFDLHLYPQDQPTTEYDDDTTSISRSSTVIAVRRPAGRGQGRAARYISGRAPVRAIKKTDVKAAATGGTTTEQDAEAAFLAESAEVWNQQKETLANAQFVRRNKKPVNVPEHEPPSGYVCYRCNKKGHWIQLCPTNNDPDFKPTARAKRTTGIPRSFLKTVEKPADDDDARGIMLNADGEYVQVMTDNRTWEKFQEKTNAAKAQAANADAANKEARERGLECPLNNRMFVDPVKTPCCGKTYCHDCIENKLADDDLVCPNCKTADILIDDLAADEEMIQKIKDFETEKEKEKLDKEQQANEEAEAPSSPSNEENNSVPPADDEAKTKAGETNRSGSKSPKPSNTSVPQSQSSSSSNVISPLTVAAKPAASRLSPGAGGSDTDTSTTSKKRKEAPTEIKPPTAPKAMRQQKEQQSRPAGPTSVEKDFLQQMEALKQMQEQSGKMPNGPMAISMGPGVQGNPMMGMVPPQGMNGMHSMAGMNGMNGGYPPHMNQWNGGGYNQGYPQQQNGMGYGNNMHSGWNHNNNGGYNNQQQHQMSGYSNGMPNNMMNGGFQGVAGRGWNQNQAFQHGGNMGGYGGQGMNAAQGVNGGQGMGGGGMNGGMGGFMNQQQPNQQDAYERKPLNPHRSQNKNRKQRAPDFHYVGQG